MYCRVNNPASVRPIIFITTESHFKYATAIMKNDVMTNMSDASIFFIWLVYSDSIILLTMKLSHLNCCVQIAII